MNTNLILICGVSLLFVFVLMIAIVFIVLQQSRKNNPPKASDVRPEPRANWLYIWLFFAPLITVPWMVATMPHPPPAYDTHNFDPAWSPDDTRIAFYSNRDGNDEIYVMNADGSQQTRLTSNGLINSYPIWSPDGKRIIGTVHRARQTALQFASVTASHSD